MLALRHLLPVLGDRLHQCLLEPAWQDHQLYSIFVLFCSYDGKCLDELIFVHLDQHLGEGKL